MAVEDPSSRRTAPPFAGGVPGDLLAGVRKRRRAVSQRFLWTLLGLVVATMLLNAMLLGPPALAPLALTPNLAFCGIIGLALWLNARHRFHAAWALVIAVVMLAATVALLTADAAAGFLSLLLYFVPVVIAGLLLDRTALYLTAGITTGVVLAAVALQTVGLAGAGEASADATRVVALQFVVVLAIVVFFLDRFSLSLNDALAEAARREVALRDEIAYRVRADAALRGEMAFSDAIIESVPGVFLVLDDRGAVIRSNRQLERVLGYDRREIAALPVERLVRPADAAPGTGIEALLAAGASTLQATVVRRDGERVPYVFNGRRFERDGTSFVTGVGIDRSELDGARRRIETLNAELRERLDRITSLHAIDMAITGNAETGDTLEVVLTQVTERLEIDAASILLYHPRRQVLIHGASRGFAAGALGATALRLGEGQAGRAALGHEPLFIDDPTALAHAFGPHPKILAERFRAYAAVPLRAKGKLQGVLELFHRDELPRADDWHDFLVTLATQAAIALDNAALLEELERSNVELRTAYDTTIEGWARALDLRDHETEGHSRRVTEMTERLAARLGLDDDALVHVRRGALLHDIGKMGVPDAILRKPGKLSEAEWGAMKRHPSYGHDLLHPIPFLRPALAIPHCHHERWDGGGYPQGLSEASIPLAARTFAVVDVYDALTSDRPYRPAWPEARALAHIEEGAGSHFDPAIVPVFLQMVRDGAWIRT